MQAVSPISNPLAAKCSQPWTCGYWANPNKRRSSYFSDFLILVRVLQVRLLSKYGCRTFSSEILLFLGAQDGLEERQSSDRKQALSGKVREPPRPVHVRCHPFSSVSFLSSISAARSSRSLSERRITHILSVCPDPIPGELPESGMTHLRIPVEDVDHADLLIYLPTAVRFIDQAMRSHGIVLVHCVQGLSRSATVVAAYCKSSGIFYLFRISCCDALK